MNFTTEMTSHRPERRIWKHYEETEARTRTNPTEERNIARLIQAMTPRPQVKEELLAATAITLGSSMCFMLFVAIVS